MQTIVGCYLYILLAVSFAVARVHGFAISITNEIALQTAPLIGGPKWLPVHVKVVVVGGAGETQRTVCDFVPLRPTEPQTLQGLLSLQAVPAEVRMSQALPPTNRLEERARDFCQAYDKDLHLIQNNCWTFAYELVQYMLSEESTTR